MNPRTNKATVAVLKSQSQEYFASHNVEMYTYHASVICRKDTLVLNPLTLTVLYNNSANHIMDSTENGSALSKYSLCNISNAAAHCALLTDSF